MRAVAGMCARRRSHFLLLAQKKVTKEEGTPVPRPSLREGTLRCSVWTGGVCKLALRAQTADPSFSVQPCAAQLRHKGTPSPVRRPTPPTLSPREREGPSAMPKASRAGRGVSRVQRRGAQRLEGCPALQERGRRGLSELRLPAMAGKKGEFRSRLPDASTAENSLRSAKGGAAPGSPFFGSFLWRDKERNCAAGRTSRHCPRSGHRPAGATFPTRHKELPHSCRGPLNSTPHRP